MDTNLTTTTFYDRLKEKHVTVLKEWEGDLKRARLQDGTRRYVKVTKQLKDALFA